VPPAAATWSRCSWEPRRARRCGRPRPCLKSEPPTPGRPGSGSASSRPGEERRRSCRTWPSSRAWKSQSPPRWVIPGQGPVGAGTAHPARREAILGSNHWTMASPGAGAVTPEALVRFFSPFLHKLHFPMKTSFPYNGLANSSPPEARSGRTCSNGSGTGPRRSGRRGRPLSGRPGSEDGGEGHSGVKNGSWGHSGQRARQAQARPGFLCAMARASLASFADRTTPCEGDPCLSGSEGRLRSSAPFCSGRIRPHLSHGLCCF
jgi:hypothetical protein